MDTIIHLITKMLVNAKQLVHDSSYRNLDQAGLRALPLQLFHRKFLFRVSQVVVSTRRRLSEFLAIKQQPQLRRNVMRWTSTSSLTNLT